MSVPVLVQKDLSRNKRENLRRDVERIRLEIERDRIAAELGRLSKTDYLARLTKNSTRFESLLGEFEKVVPRELVYEFNKLKPWVKPAVYIPRELGATPYQTIIPPLGQTGKLPIEFDETGHGEICALVSIHTGNYEFSVFDDGRRYEWSVNGINAGAVCGTARRPFMLPSTYLVSVVGASRQLTWQARDLSGAPNTVRFAMLGKRHLFRDAPPDQQKIIEEEFSAPDRNLLFFMQPKNSILALGAGLTTTSQSLVAPSDAPVEIKKLTYWSNPANQPFLLEIGEYSTGRKIAADGMLIHSDQMFGDAEYPAILFESLLLDKNFQLTFKLTNLGGGPTDFYLMFTGQKVIT